DPPFTPAPRVHAPHPCAHRPRRAVDAGALRVPRLARGQTRPHPTGGAAPPPPGAGRHTVSTSRGPARFERPGSLLNKQTGHPDVVGALTYLNRLREPE